MGRNISKKLTRNVLNYSVVQSYRYSMEAVGLSEQIMRM